VIILDERDREILARALRTVHSHTMDAITNCIRHGDVPSLPRNVDTRLRVLAMLDALGHAEDDSYRWQQLRSLAAEHSVALPRDE
jgi:hypothetical protein